MSPPSDRRFDVVILGSGPAAAACALRLRAHGLASAIVRTRHRRRAPVAQHVPGEAQPHLRALGVWERLRELSPTVCGGIASAWGETSLKAQDGLFRPYGAGWILERPAFDQMLCHAAFTAGCRVLEDVTLIHRSKVDGEHWLASPTGRVRARFLVDARGRASAHASGQRRLDGLVSVHARLPARRNPDSDALLDFLWVESCEWGWFYSCRTRDGGITAALQTDACLVPSRPSNRIAFLQNALTSAPLTGARIERLTDRCESVDVAPAHTLVPLPGPFGDSSTAIGDAAFALDPLSGKGLLHALVSGVEAADAIGQSPRRGHSSPLFRYEQLQRRRFEAELRKGKALYRAETRWGSSPFWQSRQAPPYDSSRGSSQRT